MLRLLLQVALALGKIHVLHLGKILCENPLAKLSERSVKGIRGFRERFKSVGLYPMGVAVARDVQFFPVGLLLEKGSPPDGWAVAPVATLPRSRGRTGEP
ncbi:hypothetical protein JQM83_14635 [Parabacteroides distasonis]|nr:hypothetical protein [Parabacteroides distasonis]